MTDPLTLVRLEKAALDNGFDRELPLVGAWITFCSTHAPLEIWLGASDDGHLLAAMSRPDVAGALADLGRPCAVASALGAPNCLAVKTIADLNRLLRRAYQLARTLPHQLLHDFEQKTASMPRTTEAEHLVVQRVGQDIFRAGLMEYWEGRCAITGLAVPELLRASHIKPWAVCATDAERLDVFNGLLLAPHLDAVFDRGLITVDDGGSMAVSPTLPESARALLNLDRELRVQGLAAAHHGYLQWHRSHVFRSGGGE